MQIIVNLLLSLILAIWLVAIAIIAVQNATPVSLQFLFWHSIQIPMGVLMAFSAAIGLLTLAILQPLWALADDRNDGRSEVEGDDESEFFVDD